VATILVVEDNRLNLELVTDLLESAGHTVRTAGTAEEGLRLATSERPDLILMDIRLPGMDGHAAVKILKQTPETQSIPTVALTAQAMKGDEATAILSGFDGYLSKPIDTRAFADRVKAFLSSAKPDPGSSR
jgi:two-component system cell cycle response regulator DivK